MVQRHAGIARRARSKLIKNARTKGKVSLRRYFQQLQAGEQVVLLAESSIQRGMYPTRFHGRCVVVNGKQGKCYKVSLEDGAKKKTFIVHPVHLRK